MALSGGALMRRAVRLARRSPVRPSPNPPVGALVLDAAGRIVGEGWHEGPGTPHAEIKALSAAGEAARGGMLVVTLAPCSRHGRTPPCLDAVLASGVSKVLVGTRDPHPDEAESSVDALRAAGLEVVEPVASTETRDLIEGFDLLVNAGRPRFTAKVAVTLDGRTAAADGSSQWITSAAARREVHRLRSRADGVLVGAGTVRADDPQLTVRTKGYRGPQPTRIVLDPSASLDPGSKVFDQSAPTLVLTAPDAADKAKQRYPGHVEVQTVTSEGSALSLVTASTLLGERGMLDVLVESGPKLLGALVEAQLIDRLLVYMAPKFLGASGAPVVAGLKIPSITDAVDLRFETVRRVGADIRLEGRFVR
jgi:diaminohydroxyphosphoribosylaminopyrimidine deaminase / 5-amino-6-(5-phosphoribosylamino)uracil reductase